LPGNALYSGTTFPKDPGSEPSGTGCLRYNWNDGWDDVNACANGINDGHYGYNNLQWYGFTAYHKFNDYWHISYESYLEGQVGVPNAKNPQAENIFLNGGTPFSPQFIPNNQPFLAQCKNPAVLRCNTESFGS